MTTLNLSTSSVIAPLSDLSDTLALGVFDQTNTTGQRTEVRTYAGGRRRVVSAPGETLTVSITYRALTRAQYLALRALQGQVVLWRDDRTLAVYGILSDVTAREFKARDLVEDAQLQIVEIDYSEVV